MRRISAGARTRRFRAGAALASALALASAAGAGASYPPSDGPRVDAVAFAGHGELAFVSLGALYVLDGATGALTEVVGAGRGARDPEFSPDGRWLSYALGDGDVGLARADGRRPRTILAGGGAGARWLPNGELAAGDRLFAVGPSGRLVGQGRAPAGLVGWASDGRGFAFVTRSIVRGGGRSFHGIERIELGSSLRGMRTVWRAARFAFAPASGFHGEISGGGVIVLAGGRGLLFWIDPGQGDAADGMGLYELRSPLAAPRELAVTVGDTVSVGRGGALAVGAGADRYAWMNKRVELCASATASCRPVATRPGELSLDPAWSPDGRTLAFVEASVETASDFAPATVVRWYATHALWLLHAGSPRPLEVRGTRGASTPVWSGDGRSLLYVAGDALWLIARPGAAPVRIAAPLFPPGAWPSYYGEIDWGGAFAWSEGT